MTTDNTTTQRMTQFHDDILGTMEKYVDIPPQALATVLADVFVSFAVYLGVNRDNTTELIARLHDAELEHLRGSPAPTQH